LVQGDSSVLRCDEVTLNKWSLLVRRIVLPSPLEAFLHCLTLEEEGTRFLQNVTNSPNNTSYSSRPESLTVLPQAPEILHCTNWSFIGPCNAKVFAKYNQQDATFHNLFISVRRSTCFRRFLHPSSGAQNCTYSVRYLSDQYLTLYVQF